MKSWITSRSSWPLFAECEELIAHLHRLLKEYFASKDPNRDFNFWDKASSAKEEYRHKTNMGISGKEETLHLNTLREFLELALMQDRPGHREGVGQEAEDSQHVLHQQGRSQFDLITEDGPGGKKTVKKNRKGLPCFRARKFKQIALPLFLEGPVHFLKIERDATKCRDLARRIRASGLYDRKLKMYKVNESLVDQPMEIGRTRIFSRGWLENESIWMHMEYKYLLELLRSGLYAEFYNDFKTMLIPFLKPETYGRSILENSSFIASSANPDPKIHGTGFVARLSGSTAEFIHILLHMTAGDRAVPDEQPRRAGAGVPAGPVRAGSSAAKRARRRCGSTAGGRR